MIIQLDPKEFQEIRRLVAGINNPKVTREFNNIFKFKGNDIKERKIGGFVNPLNQNVVIHIEEESAKILLGALAKHSREIGKMSKSPISITAAPKWLMLIKTIVDDVISAFR